MSELFAGIDLGGTKIAGALGTADGQIVGRVSIPTEGDDGPEHVLRRIALVVEQLEQEAGRKPQAVGLAVPGLVDVRSGVTKFLPNLHTNWREVPAGPWLSERLKCPVAVLNDVRTATLGELVYGHGKTVRDMAFFSIGTGVGGGVVIDGRLRLGPLGAAGELGHQTVMPDGPLCGCGNRGCLETLASGPAITAEAIRLMLSGHAPILHHKVDGEAGRVTVREIVEAARQGDTGAREAIDRAATYVGVGVANIVTALHPELIVVAGGVAEAGEMFLEPIRRSLRDRVRMFPSDGVRIERSLLGASVGVLGAIALAIRGSDL